MLRPSRPPATTCLYTCRPLLSSGQCAGGRKEGGDSLTHQPWETLAVVSHQSITTHHLPLHCRTRPDTVNYMERLISSLSFTFHSKRRLSLEPYLVVLWSSSVSVACSLQILLTPRRKSSGIIHNCCNCDMTDYYSYYFLRSIWIF